MKIIKTKNYEIPLRLLPAAMVQIPYNWVCNWYDSWTRWDKDKANTVLNYALPYVVEYDPVDDDYYIYTERACSLYKYVPFYLKNFAKKWESRLLNYIATDFEVDGYNKTVLNTGIYLYDKLVIFN